MKHPVELRRENGQYSHYFGTSRPPIIYLGSNNIPLLNSTKFIGGTVNRTTSAQTRL